MDVEAGSPRGDIGALIPTQNGSGIGACGRPDPSDAPHRYNYAAGIGGVAPLRAALVGRTAPKMARAQPP